MIYRKVKRIKRRNSIVVTYAKKTMNGVVANENGMVVVVVVNRYMQGLSLSFCCASNRNTSSGGGAW